MRARAELGQFVLAEQPLGVGQQGRLLVGDAVHHNSTCVWSRRIGPVALGVSFFITVFMRAPFGGGSGLHSRQALYPPSPRNQLAARPTLPAGTPLALPAAARLPSAATSNDTMAPPRVAST